MITSMLAVALLSGVTLVNDDGGWCWFQDERAIVQNGKVIVGSVASGFKEPGRAGDIEVVSWEPETGIRTRFQLFSGLESGDDAYDDHNAPAFLSRPDGRILAVFAGHGSDNHFYFRISEPDDPARWGPVCEFVPSEGSRVTYSNVYRLDQEKRVYNFFRGLDDSFKPSFATSDDEGETWETGAVVIDVPGGARHRPYVKYTSNGSDIIHLAYTEGHPHVFANSIYHSYYRNGMLHRSDGSPIVTLRKGLADPTQGTLVFRGGPDRVAWISDIHLDSQGRPYLGFSVQIGSSGVPSGTGDRDHRYYLARWSGDAWAVNEAAFGGSRLYWHEDHYTGNIALDPSSPDSVFISTNVDPVTGKPLGSRNDGGRHWEIYHGTATDGGRAWNWTPITQDSRSDNLRPIALSLGGRRVLLWLRGTYTTYTNYQLEVVGQLIPEVIPTTPDQR